MAPNAHELHFLSEQSCVRDPGGLVDRTEEAFDHQARTIRPVTIVGLPLLVDSTPRAPFQPSVPLGAPAPHLYWGSARGRAAYGVILELLRRPGPARQEVVAWTGFGRGRGRGWSA